MTKKYSYKPTRLIFNLLLSITWFAIAFSTYSRGSKESWYIYSTLALGVLHLIIFISEAVRKYFEITDHKIKINTFQSKEIELDQVIKVQVSKEGIVFFKSQKEYLAIRKSQMKKEDYEEFLQWAKGWKEEKNL